jgi:hypothetical protein
MGLTENGNSPNKEEMFEKSGYDVMSNLDGNTLLSKSP